MKILIAVLIMLSALNCKYREEAEFIFIEGNIENLPNGKLYLTEAHQWEVFLDSATVLNGKFTFRIKKSPEFIPYMASIYYSQNTITHRKLPLIFKKDPKSKVPSFETAFYLEPGVIKLKGDLNSLEKISIIAGKETELLYRYQSEFGNLYNKDTQNKYKQISNYKEIIRKHPNSFFLLRGIADNKEQYTKQEITELLELFDKDLQNSIIGNKIENYRTQFVNEGDAYPQITLRKYNSQAEKIIDNTVKVNMLVFWASWCGPCRKEIPQLKELYSKFSGRGFKISSISIDSDTLKWKEAVVNENMPWQQFWAEAQMTENLKAIFRFSSIPTTVFIDANGYKIDAFTGFDSDVIDKYALLLEKHLE